MRRMVLQNVHLVFDRREVGIHVLDVSDVARGVANFIRVQRRV
jgi:hypothetical protein